MHRAAATATAAVTTVIVLAGCNAQSSNSSAGSPSASSGTASSQGTNAAPVEVHPPGDIPDNQQFVPYRGAGFSVTVPEGWTRTTAGGSTVYTSKYNSVTITPSAAKTRPTVASARSVELPALRANSRMFAPSSVSTVTRSSGNAVLITYKAQSAVDPVTGKVALLAVERYEFWRAGRQVSLSLAAPDGSDNVDAWRTVTDSFRWTSA